jgi:hypothetical protein
MLRPAKQINPAMLPATMARTCLAPAAHAQGVKHRRRRQQADEVADEQQQDADVEQIAGQPHVLVVEHLAGMRLPGELVALEPRQAAQQEHRAGQIGINAE